MTKTALQLATQVLRDIGIIAPEEEASAADREHVEGVYLDKLEDWRNDNLVYWEADEIPQAIFRTLVELIANEIGGAFGKGSPLEERRQREVLLLRRLRRHMSREKSGFQTKAVYY